MLLRDDIINLEWDGRDGVWQAAILAEVLRPPTDKFADLFVHDALLTRTVLDRQTAASSGANRFVARLAGNRGALPPRRQTAPPLDS